ncbi:MAG: hypothetical protein VXW88_06790, partial [Pseudomonadota bacterium]|nr:hypothetical protein [Pseudomonadota bacterium]
MSSIKNNQFKDTLSISNKKVRVAMLQSKHRERSYVRNEIGKKLHTTINNGKPGNKKPTNAGTIPIRR